MTTEDEQPRRMRVLIVDDEPEVVIMVDRLVRAEGFETSGTASDARSAVTIDLRDHPDVAVVDYSLPDGNGLSVAQHLKSAHPDAFVILLSAEPVGSSVTADPAVDRFLSKSEMTQLAPLLDAIAEERGLRRHRED